MRTAFVAFRSLLYMSGFWLLWGWAAVTVRHHDGRFDPLPAGAAWLGLLMPPGAAIMLAAIGAFVLRGRGTPAPFDAPAQFVAVGPYTVVRNPMYVGGFVFLVGLGFYLLYEEYCRRVPRWIPGL